MVSQLEFKGPFKFEGDSSIFNEISKPINGVYLWCIKIDDNSYRVYYVGEAIDVKNRLSNHLTNQITGMYTGHCLESLKKNIRILMHRANDGMIPRFSEVNREQYNKELVDNLYLFYSELPVVNNKNDDKWLRCRYETGIVMHIENQGQNIVNVGHLRYWKGDKKKVKIVTSSVNIESLSNEAITI